MKDIIDEQIDKFEREIMVLRGCVTVLQGQKCLKEIEEITSKSKGEGK